MSVQIARRYWEQTFPKDTYFGGLLTYETRAWERSYAAIMQELLDLALNKPLRPGRNGNWASVFSRQLTCDLRREFPLLIGKAVPWRSVVGELEGFLGGYTSASDFRKAGTNIWNANANVTKSWVDNPNRKGEDDLGRIYGVNWRRWLSWDQQLGVSLATDQIANLVKGLREDPYGRRHVVTAWNPGELHLMALPPCHMMFQCFVDEEDALHLKMFQRSADWFLGVPFNMASYSFLLVWLAMETEKEVGSVTIDFGDCHLYETHIEQAKAYLARVKCDERFESNANLLLVQVARNGTLFPKASDFFVAGYDPLPAIAAPMSA